MNKQEFVKEFIKTLREHTDFKKLMQKELGITPAKMPFVRDVDQEEKKIQIALSEFDFETMKVVATAMQDKESIYLNVDLCKANIEEQLRKSFDTLFSNFPNVTVHNGEHGGSYSVSMDGEFFTHAEYYSNDDGAWEPAVSIRFCPVEYFEY